MGFGALNAGAGNVSLTATGSVTQSGAITASGLELLGTAGAFSLTNSGNAVTTLAVNTGSVSFSQSGGLAVGTVNSTQGVAATSTVLLRTTGATADITLNKGVSSSASGNALTLAADATVNNFGGSALSTPSGRWWSANPANARGGSATLQAVQRQSPPVRRCGPKVFLYAGADDHRFADGERQQGLRQHGGSHAGAGQLCPCRCG
jgi:hypothetical protein